MRVTMTELELCPKCGEEYLRPTAGAAIMGDNTEPFRETSDIHIYICDNCGHKKSRIEMKEYTSIIEELDAKVIKVEDPKGP
jgi:ribosomal protein L32